MEVGLAFVLGFFFGIIFVVLCKRKDGRLVIDKDSYYVAIATDPEELTKRNWINLRVYVREGAQD